MVVDIVAYPCYGREQYGEGLGVIGHVYPLGTNHAELSNAVVLPKCHVHEIVMMDHEHVIAFSICSCYTAATDRDYPLGLDVASDASHLRLN